MSPVSIFSTIAALLAASTSIAQADSPPGCPTVSAGFISIQTYWDASLGCVIHETASTPAALPSFAAEPAHVTVNEGEYASLSARIAGGAAPMVFQWMRDGKPIAGANRSRLPIPNARACDQGRYSLRVSNRAGSIESAGVSLTVNPVEDAPRRLLSGLVSD